MFDLADGMTMSAKKDGIVNMGGFIATRRKDWYEGAKGFCVQFEGYLTYGGMNGRDMNALAIGLDENTEFDNLETRIHQVGYLAMNWMSTGYPTTSRRRPCHICGCPQSADTSCPKKNSRHQTLTAEPLSGSRHTRLRNRVSAGRPRPGDPRKPLQRPGLASACHPPPRVYQQPHGCGGSRFEKMYMTNGKVLPAEFASLGKLR